MNLSIGSITNESGWETFLQMHAPQALFQSWLWGETLGREGQTVVRTGLYHDKRLVGIAAYIVVHAKRGRFVHVRHGPCVVTGQLDPATTRAYWEFYLGYLRDVAKKEHAWFVRVSPLIANTQAHRDLLRAYGLVPAAIHAMDAELCWVLDIDKSDDELLAGMRKSTRYEIRQAQKLGVTVTSTEKLAQFALFESLYEQTSKRQHFVAHKGIREEFEVFAKAGKALLLFGWHNGDILSGALVLFYGGQAIYHHGASLPSKIPVSSLVQWEAIHQAKKRNLAVYNFYGIAPENSPNHPWAGITLFKKGFGGRAVEYIHAHDLPVSAWYQVPRLVETIRKIRKGY